MRQLTILWFGNVKRNPTSLKSSTRGGVGYILRTFSEDLELAVYRVACVVEENILLTLNWKCLVIHNLVRRAATLTTHRRPPAKDMRNIHLPRNCRQGYCETVMSNNADSALLANVYNLDLI